MPEFAETEIRLIGPDGDSRPVRLSASPFIMGRSESVNLPMPGDTMLSRQHCAFEFVDGAWIIRDLGSKNGTTVNGQTIVREHRLAPRRPRRRRPPDSRVRRSPRRPLPARTQPHGVC